MLGLVVPELLKGCCFFMPKYGGVSKCHFTEQTFKGTPLPLYYEGHIVGLAIGCDFITCILTLAHPLKTMITI